MFQVLLRALQKFLSFYKLKRVDLDIVWIVIVYSLQAYAMCKVMNTRALVLSVGLVKCFYGRSEFDYICYCCFDGSDTVFLLTFSFTATQRT